MKSSSSPSSSFRRGLFLTILAFFSVAPKARAQVVFDNIGNSNPFVASIGYALGSGSLREVAFQFTAGAGGFLDYADLRLWRLGGNRTVNVALLTNSVSNTPGAVLETSSVLAPNTLSLVPISHVEFSNSTLLSAGTIYWARPEDVRS